MADRVFGDNIVSLDMIDDVHVGTVTFHNALGDELHRAPVIGRMSVVYHYHGPDGRTVQARAWVGDQCVHEFSVLTMLSGQYLHGELGLMTVFTFDATVSSHDLLKAGVTEARLPGSTHHHHRVVVEAGTRDEAALVAAQMVCCIPGAMCTGLYDRI